jgi:hypothetical protein
MIDNESGEAGGVTRTKTSVNWLAIYVCATGSGCRLCYSRSLQVRNILISWLSAKGNQTCHVEPLFRSLHPLSSVSDLLRLFQLMPRHIIAVASIVVGSIVVAFTVVATTVVYVLEWR